MIVLRLTLSWFSCGELRSRAGEMLCVATARAAWIISMLVGAMLVGAGAIAADPVRSEVVLRAETSFDGTLTDVTEQGEFVFVAGGQSRRIATSELVRWGRYVDRGDGTQILLTDGSILVADVLNIESDAISVIGRMWREARLPRAAVRAIFFHLPADVEQRDKLFYRALEPGKPESRLLLANGDELAGSLPDTVSREAGALQLTRVVWTVPEPGVAPVEVPLERVAAVLLPVELSQRAAGQIGGIVVGLRDGSLLRAQAMRRVNQGLEFQTVNGISLTTDVLAGGSDGPWSDVVMLQPFPSHITYISDIPKLGYKDVPYLDREWPFQLDRSLSGGRLRHNNGVWVKGIAMHSGSRLAVELGGSYEAFQAELGIDQRAGRQGSVVFRVYVQDVNGDWQKAYESGIVRGGDDLVPVRVDLAGAPRLALLVDFADRGDQWDHALWLDARLVKRP